MYKQEVMITEIKSDIPFQNYEFIQISFAYPMDKDVINNGIKSPIYKHLAHIFIPKKEWKKQYNIGDKYMMQIYDDGKINLEKMEGN